MDLLSTLRVHPSVDKAIDAVPAGRPDCAGWLDNLGNSLGERYAETAVMDDLEEVIGFASDSAAAALHGVKSPSVALCLLEQGRGVLATSLDEMRGHLASRKRTSQAGGEILLS